MRVLLVDDHLLFTEGLRNVLTGRGISVVGTAPDGMEAIRQTRVLKPDVVLMDIRMPRCDGLEATRLIKAEMPGIRVVILTTSEADDDLFEAIKCGASGYLLKSLEPDLFISLLLGLASGQAAISREMAAKIIDEFARTKVPAPEGSNGTPAPLERIDDLTDLQNEVLLLVAKGHTYKEIAGTLGIAERTVEYHMGAIINKLQLQNRAQVIAYAMKKGLIKDDVSSAD